MCQCFWCLCYLSVQYVILVCNEQNRTPIPYTNIYTHTHSCWIYIYIYMYMSCVLSQKLPNFPAAHKPRRDYVCVCEHFGYFWIWMCVCIVSLFAFVYCQSSEICQNLFVVHDYFCIPSSRNLSTIRSEMKKKAFDLLIPICIKHFRTHYY